MVGIGGHHDDLVLRAELHRRHLYFLSDVDSSNDLKGLFGLTAYFDFII